MLVFRVGHAGWIDKSIYRIGSCQRWVGRFFVLMHTSNLVLRCKLQKKSSSGNSLKLSTSLIIEKVFYLRQDHFKFPGVCVGVSGGLYVCVGLLA